MIYLCFEYSLSPVNFCYLARLYTFAILRRKGNCFFLTLKQKYIIYHTFLHDNPKRISCAVYRTKISQTVLGRLVRYVVKSSLSYDNRL